MKVLCNAVVSNCEPLIIPRNCRKAICDNNIVVSSEWYTIDSTLSGYSISKGKEYDVYAILIYANQIRYLLLDDYGAPGFFPAQLFLISESTILSDWRIAEYPLSSQPLYLIGFPAITQTYNDLVNLIEGKKDAIVSLLEYRKFITHYSAF